MTGKAMRRYQMLMRVAAFDAERADTFPPGTRGAQMFAAVREVVRTLERHAVTHASARARGAVSPKKAARIRLRQRLRVISRTARAMAIDAQPGASVFRVPRTNGDHALLAAARLFAQEARASKTAFVELGLPAAFLDDLDADIKAMERASSDYRALRQSGVAASAGIDAVLRQAVASVRRLDAIVANLHRDDPATMVAWRRARRVWAASSRQSNSRQSTVRQSAVRQSTAVSHARRPPTSAGTRDG